MARLRLALSGASPRFTLHAALSRRGGVRRERATLFLSAQTGTARPDLWRSSPPDASQGALWGALPLSRWFYFRFQYLPLMLLCWWMARCYFVASFFLLLGRQLLSGGSAASLACSASLVRTPPTLRSSGLYPSFSRVGMGSTSARLIRSVSALLFRVSREYATFRDF